MKKVCCIVLMILMLTGCAAGETIETIADDMVFSQAAPGEIQVSLPEETVLPVMETEAGKLYICRDFEVSVQTLAGGDLDATVRTLCGFGLGDVNVLETEADGLTRYDFVWSSAGELGDQVGRAAILSDGVYHYCVTAMAPEGKAKEYQEIWNGMFETVTIG